MDYLTMLPDYDDDFEDADLAIDELEVLEEEGY